MKVTIGIAVALAIIACGFLFFYSGQLFQTSPSAVSGPTGINMYANGTYGVSFQYPATYHIQEGTRTDRPHNRYAITLLQESDVTLPIGGEGPPTITVDIYENAEGQTLSNWVTSASESNFSLGDKQLRDVSVNGVSALQFRWSGLYEGETTAFLSDDFVIAVSVTYLSPEDAIVGDYRALLDTLYLSK